MQRFYLREQGLEKSSLSDRFKLGVLGIGRGSGASLIATSLASALSSVEKKRLAYIELSCFREKAEAEKRASGMPSLLYDALGMDQRFAGREFISFRRELAGLRKLRELKNIDEGINWALATPEDAREGLNLSEAQAIRLANGIAGDIVICDIEALSGYRDLVKDLDLLIAVIDPLPSKLIPAAKELRYLFELSEEQEIIFVVNKMNDGVLKRELDSFLKLKSYESLPYITPEPLYKAEYNCALPYSRREVREALEPFIKLIVNKVL